MRRFLIERLIPGVGGMSPAQFCDAAATSNRVLAELGPGVQWVQSYVADDRLFCVYLAEDEDRVRQHAEKSGFPADRIIPVTRVIDPLTANA